MQSNTKFIEGIRLFKLQNRTPAKPIKLVYCYLIKFTTLYCGKQILVCRSAFRVTKSRVSRVRKYGNFTKALPLDVSPTDPQLIVETVAVSLTFGRNPDVNGTSHQLYPFQCISTASLAVVPQ